MGKFGTHSIEEKRKRSKQRKKWKKSKVKKVVLAQRASEEVHSLDAELGQPNSCTANPSQERNQEVERDGEACHAAQSEEQVMLRESNGEKMPSRVVETRDGQTSNAAYCELHQVASRN